MFVNTFKYLKINRKLISLLSTDRFIIFQLKKIIPGDEYT